jgi:integrase
MRIISRFKYVDQYRDRHGRQRYYLRRKGQPRIALPGLPGSPEFAEAYHAALANPAPREIGADHSPLGSLSAAIASYYGDHSFLALAPITQKNRRAILERFRKAHGDNPLRELAQKHMTAILGKMLPFAQHGYLKAVRHLMQYAVRVGLRTDDPTAGITQARSTKVKTDGRERGYHTWTEDEIAQFEAKHPVGSRPRLAMALLLYTGQRRGDVVKMGPQQFRGGKFTIRQQKTQQSMDVPIHPDLARIIAASECGNLVFLVTQFGKSFSAPGFGNLFRDWCNEAGLPHCSAHGLRKAICRRLAEAGCTAPQIAAISGHRSLKEVQRYIEAADRSRLAEAGMASAIPDAEWPTTGTPGLKKCLTILGGLGTFPKKPNNINPILEGWLPGPDSNQRQGG